MAATSSERLPGIRPIPRTRLIGRESELATARAHFLDDAVALLTLTGPGGVGKTHLALTIADDVASHFAQSVIWVDLAPLADAALVPATIAAALGLTLPPDRPISEEMARRLHASQTLLLLDNCEHVLAETANVIGQLLSHCPAVQILATSRAPLRLRGEHLMPLAPLPLPAVETPSLEAIAQNAAVRLFVARAQAVQPQFRLDTRNAPTVAALCRALDGLPLAIELSAARSAILSPDALLAQMTDRLRLLTHGARDLPARQQTIAATIGWSYDLLDPEAQALFRRLAVFTGGFTLEAAEAVGGRCDPAAPPSVFDGLETLIEQSLVRRMADEDPPRFTMLETIREFGLARLAERGEEQELRDRHAAYFRDLAEAAELHLHGMGDDQAGWMARMDAELGNLRAAIAWLLASGDGTEALRLIVGIEAYIGARPIQAEARGWVETALRLASDAPATLRAAALYGLVTRTGLLGDSAASVAAAEEALVLAEATDDAFVLGRAYFGLGIAWNFCEDIERAMEAYARSVPYFRQTDRIDFMASALAGLGHAHQQSGNHERAREALDDALACHRQIDDPTWSTGTLLWRGHLARAEGDPALAVKAFTDCLALAGEVRFERLALEAVVGLAGVALDIGQAARAARLLGAVAARGEATGTWSEVMSDDSARQVMTAARDRMRSDRFTTAFEEGRGVPWADAVTDACAVLEPEETTPRHYPRAQDADAFAFTRREREILALLCQRLTDPEIAERLFISPRTASKHVGNILGKLGASSRREAAAIAARHGLV